MSPWELYLFEKTRETRVMIWTVGIILVSGVLLSALFGFISDHSSTGPYFVGNQSDEQIHELTLVHWQHLLDDPELALCDFLEEMPDLIIGLDRSHLKKARAALEKADFSPEEKEVLEAVFDSMVLDPIRPNQPLLDLSQQEPPLRYAQHGLGLVLYEANEDFQSARAYEKEGVFPDAEHAREIAVSIYSDLNRLSDLERLSADPAFKEYINQKIQFRMASERQDWGGVWRHLVPSQYEDLRPEIVLLALLSGVIWLAISCRLLQLKTLRSQSFALCLAGFFLGVISTWPTVFLYVWIEQILGLTERSELLNDVVFYIFGVGLNEESMKLLCFCPLIPILLRRDNQLEILLVAGCVGLGFAAEENIMYFTEGTDVVAGRFVTANFLHISATALCGLALCRAISDPVGHGSIFLKWFGGIVLIHGLYDVLGSIPNIDQRGILSMVCYIYLCYKFFAQTHELRQPHGQVIGLNFIFLSGLAILTAVAMIDLSYAYGFQAGMSMIVMEIAGVCIICYLFVREFAKN